MLGIYVPPTAKVIQRRDLGLKSHPKDCVSDKYLWECMVVHRVLRQFKKEQLLRYMYLKYDNLISHTQYFNLRMSNAFSHFIGSALMYVAVFARSKSL